MQQWVLLIQFKLCNWNALFTYFINYKYIFLMGGIEIHFWPPPLDPKNNDGGSVNIFHRPPPLPHQKIMFSTTVHPTRKNLIFPGCLLKADHCEKKLKRGGVPFLFYGKCKQKYQCAHSGAVYHCIFMKGVRV